MKKFVLVLFLLGLSFISQAATYQPLAALVGLSNGNYSIAQDLSGNWDVAVSVNLQAGSKRITSYDYGDPSDGTFITPISGVLSLYFNHQYSGRPQVGINLTGAFINGNQPLSGLFSAADTSGNSTVMTLNSSQGVTTKLAEHIPDYYFVDECNSFPSDPMCLNYDDGNSTTNPLIPIPTVEGGVDNILNLGPLAFVEDGGITTTMIDLEGFLLSDQQLVSLLLSQSGDYQSDTFLFNPTVVPLPAAGWMFLSSIIIFVVRNRVSKNA